MYMVRKPESIRSPALQRSANTIVPGSWNRCLALVRVTCCSPALASAAAGSRIARIVPAANTRNA